MAFAHTFTRENPGKITDFYKLPPKKKGNLGEGSYGVVRSMLSVKDPTIQRAVKEIQKNKVKEKEITIQKQLDHPNIVRLYECFRDAKNVYLVMEELDGGELFDRIIDAAEHSDSEMAFSENVASRYMKQIVGAMQYLHSEPRYIAHRDIKPENFLMENKTAEAGIKVIDFGLAAKFEEPGKNTMKTKAGTPYYVAPDVLQGPYCEKCDVWSCGVIAYILLSGVPPFFGDNDKQILNAVKKGEFEYTSPEWDNISKDSKHMITKMLTKIPANRPSFQVVNDMDWLQNKQSTGKIQRPDLKANLQKFRDASKFEKVVMTVMAGHLSEKEQEDIKTVFKQLDKNNDGTLTLKELSEGLKELNISDEILSAIDTDGSKQIDYTEFLAAAMDRKKIQNDNKLWAVFRTMDLDGDGQITKEELQKCVDGTEGVHEIPSEDIITMIKGIDKDGDGTISWDEFKAALSR